MIFDKPYVEVQGELDEVSAIGGGEEMSWEEMMSIDGSEDEQSDNNEVISENDDVLAQMVATKDTNMDFDFEAFSMSSLQEQSVLSNRIQYKWIIITSSTSLLSNDETQRTKRIWTRMNLRNGETLIACSDGSYDPIEQKAAFNWRIVTENETGLTSGSAPVNTNPKYLNPKLLLSRVCRPSGSDKIYEKA
eukprot:scaffold52669_cov40-Cyclotella_meneghiniana.AAC.16